MKKTIVIVGGSGFIGTKLSEVLLAKGYAVRIVDLVAPRIQHSDLSFVVENIADGASAPVLFEGSTAVVNLAGVTIGRRWNKAYKEKIVASRIETTRALVSLIGTCIQKPTVLVQASAVGYYGDRGSLVLTEDTPSGTDFLAQVCVEWESEAIRGEQLGLRVVRIRTANVLGPGGLLASLLPLFRRGLGGYFGFGKQHMPWIHWKDIVGMYVYAIEQPLAGAFNASAGTTPTQKELFTAFARAIHAFFVWPIPYVLAWLLFGEFADVLVGSQNVSSRKISQAGYVYEFEDLTTALHDIYPVT